MTVALGILSGVLAILAGWLVAEDVNERVYIYAWGNTPERALMKRRECIVLARGTLNSALLQFVDSGEKVVTSRSALRVHRTLLAGDDD